jgi:flagellar hook protein FlgE
VNGAIQYSRNGQFHDKNGFIVNAQKAQLTGYCGRCERQDPAGAVVPLQIDQSDMTPQATTKANPGQPRFQTTMPTVVPFTAGDATIDHQQFPVKSSIRWAIPHHVEFLRQDGHQHLGRSLGHGWHGKDQRKVAALRRRTRSLAARRRLPGGRHGVPLVPANVTAAAVAYGNAAGAAVLGRRRRRGATPAQLAAIAATYGSAVPDGINSSRTPDQIDAAIRAVTEVPAVKTGSLVFNTVGSLDRAAMLALTPPQTLPVTVNLPIFPATGANATLSVQVDFSKSTQLGTATAEKKTEADGYKAGQLSQFIVGDDGVIQGQYNNGKTRSLGQVVLSNFTNPNGLEPLGNNAWVESSASGKPITGEPKTGTWATCVPRPWKCRTST